MSNARQGFILAQTGGMAPVTKTYKVLATANNAYYPGDPVRLNGNGELSLVSASSADMIGVIAAVYSNVGGEKRPLTFSQPNNGPYLTSGAAGFAEVIIDRNATFRAQIDVTASVGLIGSNINVSAGAPNTRAGISGYNLKGASIGTSANRVFKIVEISPFETSQTGRTADVASGGGVLVRMTNPQLYQTTGF